MTKLIKKVVHKVLSFIKKEKATIESNRIDTISVPYNIRLDTAKKLISKNAMDKDKAIELFKINPNDL